MILDTGVVAEGAYDLEQLILDVFQLLLSTILIQPPLLDIDRQPIEVFDGVDHVVGGVAKLVEPTFFRQRAMQALLDLVWRKFLRLSYRLEHTGAGDRPVILERQIGTRGVRKAQPADILNAVVTDAKYDVVLPSVDGNRADCVIGAGGRGHGKSRLSPGLNCNRLPPLL